MAGSTTKQSSPGPAIAAENIIVLAQKELIKPDKPAWASSSQLNHGVFNVFNVGGSSHESAGITPSLGSLSPWLIGRPRSAELTAHVCAFKVHGRKNIELYEIKDVMIDPFHPPFFGDGFTIITTYIPNNSN